MWQQMYDVHQVAAQLLLSEHTVYALLRSGELKGVRAGRRSWRVEESAIRDYLRGDRGQHPRIAARQIRLVHFVEAKPESVCYEFPDGARVKLTMYDARRILQSPEVANGRGIDIDGHHLSNQDALNLMAALVSYFVKVAPAGAARIFTTKGKRRGPSTAP
jgi:excisionase family DNA binding protein